MQAQRQFRAVPPPCLCKTLYAPDAGRLYLFHVVISYHYVKQSELLGDWPPVPVTEGNKNGQYWHPHDFLPR
jgi:hypothetical protein